MASPISGVRRWKPWRPAAGDCEDYAIAKFAMLLDAGIAEKDLKVLLVRDMAVRQDHAVLAVRIDGRWLVLDNRRFGLAEAGDLPYFMPLFAIDHERRQPVRRALCRCRTSAP